MIAVADLGASPEIPVWLWILSLATLTAGIVTAVSARATALYGPEKLSRAERRASRRFLRVRA